MPQLKMRLQAGWDLHEALQRERLKAAGGASSAL
jgi:hypothetical protein